MKLGVTLVLTVTQAYVFANLRQVTGVLPHKHAALNLSDIPSERITMTKLRGLHLAAIQLLQYPTSVLLMRKL